MSEVRGQREPVFIFLLWYYPRSVLFIHPWTDAQVLKEYNHAPSSPNPRLGLPQLMEQVLQGVRGMRQSMLDMHRTRAQASFARVVGSALRDVSAAVDDSLEATSRRSALLPASILACCHRGARTEVRLGKAGGGYTDPTSFLFFSSRRRPPPNSVLDPPFKTRHRL